MNKRCPKCGTAFNVGPEDDGKQFTCFKCKSALVMTQDGLRLAGADAPSALGAQPGPAAPELYAVPPPARGPGRRSFWRAVDWPTWLFGLGAWLVIIFLFFPLMGQARARQTLAELEIGRLREERLDRELDEKKDAATTAEKETRKKAKETWAKEEARLKDAADAAKADVDMQDYWYLWGMMFGFLVLGAAALCYLVPAQPLIRRIVGAIVIVAEVVLIFLKFVVGGR